MNGAGNELMGGELRTCRDTRTSFSETPETNTGRKHTHSGSVAAYGTHTCTSFLQRVVFYT